MTPVWSTKRIINKQNTSEKLAKRQTDRQSDRQRPCKQSSLWSSGRPTDGQTARVSDLIAKCEALMIEVA